MTVGSRVLRRYLTALEFPNQGALNKYLDQHPKAKKNNHWVKGQKPDGAAKKDEPAKSHAKPEKPQLSFPFSKFKEDKPKGKGKPKAKPKEKAKAKEPKEKAKPKAGQHPLQQKNLKVIERRKIGTGEIGAEFIDVKTPDGKKHKGIWKSIKGEFLAEEENGQLRENINAGTYYEREAVASDVDAIFGGKRVIPHTFVQEFEDEGTGEPVLGSLQEYVPGTVTTSQVIDYVRNDDDYKKLASSFEAKKMTFMDLITGNDDRHSGNALWIKNPKHGFVPSAIDNGLTFPDGDSCRFLFPISDSIYQEEVLKPSEEIHQLLGDLDIKALAKRLNDSGLEYHAKVRTLARAQALKNTPDLLVERLLESGGDDPENAAYLWVNENSQERVDRGEIEPYELENIKKLVTGAG